jgi:serine/threonine protein kinase/tetratricopeptide (TPR) repeat protein
VGPYRLLEPIGSGGMATVYAAIHEHMARKVAVKLLSPDAAREPQIVARFLQEARALANLDHPGIVRVLGCDRLGDGTVYLAMEYLDGISLREWLRRREPANLGDVLGIARQIAEAMMAVHERGIVHRDLKPENILLLDDEAERGGWRVKVLDFGVAKVPPTEQPGAIDTRIDTRAPLLLGTATYMAPEQCRNAAEVTDRADVYALGVVLFEMLAGPPPFVSHEAIDLISMHLQMRPPPIRQFDPGIPAELDVFVASMLAKEPVSRPTMRRVREVLGQPWENRHGEPGECPLPGLQAFTETHAELFFGRRSEVEEILSLLGQTRAGESRWIVVEGTSGVGKSSLVHAGVLPALKEDRMEGADRWRIARLRPSADPLRELSRALVDAYAGTKLEHTREEIERSLRDDAGALRSLAAAHTTDDCVLLLVIERLEELLAVAAGDLEQLDALLSRVSSAESPICVLATLCIEFAHRLDAAPGLARLVRTAARYRLRVMNAPDQIDAIEWMAQRAGMRLAEGLATRMVRDASGLGSPLPLLGHTLRGLWTPHLEALVTHENYERTGGVAGALARHAELLLDSLGEDGRVRAKWLVLSLVQVGRGVPDTRRPRAEEEVVAAAGGDRAASDILMRLSGMVGVESGADAPQNMRLVAVSEAFEASGRRVELVHDTLLRQVPAIAGWIGEERALLERHADLEIAAQAWEHSGYPADGLPSGTLLEHYAGSARDGRRRGLFQRVASERARGFIDAAARLEQRRRRVRRVITGALLALLLVLAITAMYARREQSRAEGNLGYVIQAADDVVSEADWKLARLHHTRPVRRQMLEQIDRRLASLLETESADLAVRTAAIRARHRRGDLAWHDETLANAERLFTQAAEMIEGGRARWPEHGGLLALLALNHSKQGKIALARGQLAHARAHFAGALALMEPGLDQTSDDSRRTLATSYTEQAELELEWGNLDAALRLYDKSLALLARNSGDYDDSLKAVTLAQSGGAARRAGDMTDAAARIERALAVQWALAETNPGNAFHQWGLGCVLVELGTLRAEQGRPAEAAEHFEHARELGNKLHDGDRTSKRYALLLGQSLRGLEAVARRRGSLPEADEIRHIGCELFNKFKQLDLEDARFAIADCR